MSPSPMSPSPENSPVSSSASVEFSKHERLYLLKLAHDAIVSVFEQREPQYLSSFHLTERIKESRGVFTTLYYRGALRGCVGQVLPTAALYGTVAETARAAAFEDTRFSPVTREEAGELEVSLSILSRLEPIRPDEVEVGRHGLLVSLGGRRGLLLPQVPVEQRWDRVTFLEQTCRKAGLPRDAWQRGATLQGFTAEVFGDADFLP